MTAVSDDSIESAVSSDDTAEPCATNSESTAVCISNSQGSSIRGLYSRSSAESGHSTATTNSSTGLVIEFSPSVKTWACALLFTMLSALVAPLFLFRTYSMPISPLFFPVLVYPLCKQSVSETTPGKTSVDENNKGRAVVHVNSIITENNKAKQGLGFFTSKWNRVQRRCRGFNIGTFSREEMVWITSMVAAGGSFAPAYQWIATVDTDYGQPLGHWQKFAVVMSSQLLGWSLGQMLRHVFVGRGNGMVWPDNLPLSFLIQTLFPTPHAAQDERGDKGGGQNSGESSDEDRRGGDITAVESHATITGIFVEEHLGSPSAEAKKVEIHEDQEEEIAVTAVLSTSMGRKRNLVLMTSATFVYQFVVSYIAPVFKSLCLLCIWAPKSRVLGQLGSGWNGAGILSMTFDWTAMGTLQPLVTPLWAQMHYYAGAALMMYVLTPVGWSLDWWGGRALPIVSTSVFDVGGSVYNISLVQHHGEPLLSGQVAAATLAFNAYSPVRLSVNSALGYICAVAAITAAAMHLAIWHPQWLRQAAGDMFSALLRLWDPRLLLRSRRARTGGGHGCGAWNVAYVAGRVGRVLVFTLSLGAALLSAQMGISRLPGWQVLVAVVWAVLMCLPTGFVEAVTGFTLPMDLLPHIFAGWMQGPGRPIETSYFHLWATVPIQVALGWPGVRSLQLVHHCCGSSSSSSSSCPSSTTDTTEQSSNAAQSSTTQPQRPVRQLPWMRRGLLVGVIWGACINHISYTLFLGSQGDARPLPIEFVGSQQQLPEAPTYTDETAMGPVLPATIQESLDAGADGTLLLGWHEEGEFGRLPAALSSELVVWGIVGPQSLFAADSPYRLLFVHGALVGLSLPLLLYTAHRLLDSTANAMGRRSLAHARHPKAYGLLRRAAHATRETQVPLLLTGMVAVPTIPANFVLSGLLVAVAGQVWCSRHKKTLVDRSLYSAAMDTGTRLSVAALFIIGQILYRHRMPLSFVSWWGNEAGNVEHCLI